MAKVNKDTVMVKIEGIATAYYSGATAQGRVFVPKSEIDMDYFEGIDFSVSELDGKHSETQGEITFTEGTLEHFVNNEDLSKNNDSFDSMLSLVVERLDEDIDYDSFEELNTEISNMSIREKISVKLTKDLLIEGVNFPKDTVLTQFKVNVENLNNFEFEFGKDEE